jgi:hypothetical protein
VLYPSLLWTLGLLLPLSAATCWLKRNAAFDWPWDGDAKLPLPGEAAALGRPVALAHDHDDQGAVAGGNRAGPPGVACPGAGQVVRGAEQQRGSDVGSGLPSGADCAEIEQPVTAPQHLKLA